MSDSSVCPKCGFSREAAALECPACGIIFARYDPDRLAGHRRQVLEPGQGAEGPWVPPPPADPDSLNPYQAPEAPVADLAPAGLFEQPLADRGARLLAQLLNSLIVLGPLVVIFLFMLPFFGEEPENEGTFAVFGCFAVLYAGVLAAFNLYYLNRDGQSLGKKIMGIRIVQIDGRPVGLGRLLVLRWLVPTLLGAIPVLGSLFSLVNVLFIFGEDRRCVHDHIADTKVVVA